MRDCKQFKLFVTITDALNSQYLTKESDISTTRFLGGKVEYSPVLNKGRIDELSKSNGR